MLIGNGFYRYNGEPGITTDGLNGENGLSMTVKKDTYGAWYLAVTTDIKGDLNGDHQVNINDAIKFSQFYGQEPGWTCPWTGVTYNVYTWMEGDFTGDGLVGDNDWNILLMNMGRHYDPSP